MKDWERQAFYAGFREGFMDVMEPFVFIIVFAIVIFGFILSAMLNPICAVIEGIIGAFIIFYLIRWFEQPKRPYTSNYIREGI